MTLVRNGWAPIFALSCALGATAQGCGDESGTGTTTNGGSAGSGATTTDGGEAGDMTTGTGGLGQGGNTGGAGTTGGVSGDSGADGSGTGGNGKGGNGASAGMSGGSGGADSGGKGGGAGAGGGCDGCSCAGMTGDECQGESCCESLPVMGGTFSQGEPDAFESTVSSFRLDKYEVTVARFRRFHTVYDEWLAAGNPATNAGAGADVNSGWDATWAGRLPATNNDLGESVSCNGMYQTWQVSSGNENLPMSCASWFVAFAFCIWDGGRLPTEAEWEYAAVGGSDDFLYPWGNSPVPSGVQDDTAAYAAYGCLADGSGASSCTAADIPLVGSKPAGAGSYDHLDLAGSMGEWVFDWRADYPTSASTNYVRIDGTGSTGRVVRGGSWRNDASFLAAAGRVAIGPTVRDDQTGFRCARSAL